MFLSSTTFDTVDIVSAQTHECRAWRGHFRDKEKRTKINLVSSLVTANGYCGSAAACALNWYFLSNIIIAFTKDDGTCVCVYCKQALQRFESENKMTRHTVTTGKKCMCVWTQYRARAEEKEKKIESEMMECKQSTWSMEHGWCLHGTLWYFVLNKSVCALCLRCAQFVAKLSSARLARFNSASSTFGITFLLSIPSA